MSKDFFNSWKTWEKLVFILACAIVVTVLLGCIKLIYTHWRLRKYAAVEKERKEQNLHRQLSQRRNSCRRAGSDTVPFGIRALESGIETEGVWISPAHTPEMASRNSLPLLSPWDTSREDHPKHDGNRQLLQPHNFIRPDSAAAMEQTSLSSFDRSNLVQNPPSSGSRKDPSPDAHITKPARSRHPPLSYTKYQGNPYILRRQSSATSTLQGLEAIYRASTSIHHQSGGSAESTLSSNQSSNGAVDVAPISASAPDLLTGQSVSKLIHSSASTDFDLLDSHRLSQVAETGQLTPRGRGHGNAHTWEFSTPSARTSMSGERSHDTEGHPRPEQYSHEPQLSRNPVSAPNLGALSPALQRNSMPDVIPFTSFCKMAPPSPPLASTRSISLESVLTITSKSEEQADLNSGSSSPIIPASEGAAVLKLPPPPKRGSFEKHTPQIIRGHGSGFEILKPGSFHPPMPKEIDFQKKWNCPPLSLHNASHPRSSGAESQRKLQKKWRFSLASSTSSKADRRSQAGGVL